MIHSQERTTPDTLSPHEFQSLSVSHTHTYTHTLEVDNAMTTQFHVKSKVKTNIRPLLSLVPCRLSKVALPVIITAHTYGGGGGGGGVH